MIRAWLTAAGVYGDRRVLSLLFFGFASGLPLALTGDTLKAWFSDAGTDLTNIGLLSLIGLAYALKFLWSPLVDRCPLPVLTRRLGRRRSWILLSQVALIGALIAIALTDPKSAGFWTVLWAVIVAFASATQDIGIDAYRTEILEENQLGAGAANLVFGYRIGMLVSGGGALLLADMLGWFWAYIAMAAVMGCGIAVVLLNPEPKVRESAAQRQFRDQSERTAGRLRGMPKFLRSWLHWMYEAVVCPFAEFMMRPGWILILFFVAFYKYGDALLGNMAVPFYLDIGFSKSEIGVVSKGFGLAMTLVGAGLGGVLVARYGILKALLFAGILQAVSNLVFVGQAWVGYSLPMLATTISIENLTGGMGTTAFVAYLSSLCNVAYTATQYALLSSLTAFARTFFAAGGGWLADQTEHWVLYFILTTIAALPGLLLLVWMIKRFPPPTAQEA